MRFDTLSEVREPVAYLDKSKVLTPGSTGRKIHPASWKNVTSLLLTEQQTD